MKRRHQELSLQRVIVKLQEPHIMLLLQVHHLLLEVRNRKRTLSLTKVTIIEYKIQGFMMREKTPPCSICKFLSFNITSYALCSASLRITDLSNIQRNYICFLLFPLLHNVCTIRVECISIFCPVYTSTINSKNIILCVMSQRMNKYWA